MKQLQVSDKCNGCGLCIVNCDYLQENEEGYAIPAVGKSIKTNDFEVIEKIISECPENAITIIDNSNTNKKGKEGLNDLVEVLKKKADNFSVKRVSKKEVLFACDNYKLDFPYSTLENSSRNNYKSKSAAVSGARSEFSRLYYSESAYRPVLKKLFVEYKVKYLKPYYTLEDTEESAYYSYNNDIRNMLSNIYTEAMELCQGSCDLSEEWKSFYISFKRDDMSIYCLREFDELSTNSGIISEFKSSGEYTSLDWYIDRMDFDCWEKYVGKGLFGDKYENEWSFHGFEASVKEYIDDFKKAIGYKADALSESATERINSALEDYEKKAKELLKIKITELEKITAI